MITESQDYGMLLEVDGSYIIPVPFMCKLTERKPTSQLEMSLPRQQTAKHNSSTRIWQHPLIQIQLNQLTIPNGTVTERIIR
jgi:hypothetical protein